MFGKPVETPADGAGNGEGTGEPAEDPMDDLLEQLRTSLPRVDSLAGDAEDQSNQLMKMAEERLHNGKYFDAEALYRQARNSNPGFGFRHSHSSCGMCVQ